MANDESKKSPESAYQELVLSDAADALPPIDFTTFVLSLSTSALVSLGELPDDEAGARRTDLALARQTIDLIGLLQDKTHGNLTGEEERLLGQVVLDLRLKFVDVAGREKKKG